MTVVRKVRDVDLQNIIDHRNNTASLMCKAYTVAQLSMIENVSKEVIYKSWKYIPVRIDWSQARKKTQRGYSVKYIMVSEFEKILSKKLWFQIHITK